ncbi:MAG: FG-GAP repeat domain-containing protein [Nitrospiraceae bacterium]
MTVYRRPAFRGPAAWGVLLLAWLTAAGCPAREPFVPPDPFYLYATYAVGKNPTSVTTADFNQDGLTDLIVTNIGNDSLSILFGNGDGSFEESRRLAVSVEPRALALNDYNGDGRTDIAVACAGSDQVALFFGLANGQFGEGQRYPVQRTPVSIATGDVNGDNKPDLVVALRNDKIIVLLGLGDGTFTPGPRYEYGDTPTSIALADLTQDGRLDLIVTNGGPMSNAVTIWTGNGDGSFRDPTDYRTGKRPLGVGFADFNNDHKTDLLIINGERDTFTVFLGNGNGTFQDGKESGADAGPVGGATGDFDGDRTTDVAIVNIQSSDLSILFGRGDGTFKYPPKNYRVNAGPFAVTPLPLRLNETEQPGLAVVNNGAGNVSIFLHRGLKAIAPPPTAPS